MPLDPQGLSGLALYGEVSPGVFEPLTLLLGVGGAAVVVDAGLKLKRYSDSLYDYWCEALPGAQLTDPAWRIMRVAKSTGDSDWAGGTALFDKVASDITSVANMVYS